jgi:hypothetical protein
MPTNKLSSLETCCRMHMTISTVYCYSRWCLCVVTDPCVCVNSSGFVTPLCIQNRCKYPPTFALARLRSLWSPDHVCLMPVSTCFADKAHQPRRWRGGTCGGEEAGRPAERQRPRLPVHGDHVAAAGQRHALRRGGDGRDPGADGRGRGDRRELFGGRAVSGVLILCGRRHALPSRVRAAQRGRSRA